MKRIGLPGILIVEPDPDWIKEYRGYFWFKANTVFVKQIAEALAYLDRNEPRIEVVMLDYTISDRHLLPELAEVFVGPIIGTTYTVEFALLNRCYEIEEALDYLSFKMKAAETAKKFLESIQNIVGFYPLEERMAKLRYLRAIGYAKMSAIFALESLIDSDSAFLPFECEEEGGRIRTIISSKINLGATGF